MSEGRSAVITGVTGQDGAYLAQLLLRDRLPIVLSRPFNCTGVGQAGQLLIRKIVDHFARRASGIDLGNQDVARDFSDVRAVVRACRGLIERRPVGETINICSGQSRSIAEILRICHDITGHGLSVVSVPQLQRAQDIARLWGSNEKLRSLLPDWQSPTLEKTLRWTFDKARVGARGDGAA